MPKIDIINDKKNTYWQGKMINKNILRSESKDKLIERIWELENQLEHKEKEISKLEGQLKINSQNSSKPSSTSIFGKKTPICNSRIKGQNLRWWVKEHRGSNLKREESIDKVVNLTPCSCKKCKLQFSKTFLNNLEIITRQVIDLNKLKKFVTDFQKSNVECPKCGFLNVVDFPKSVTRPVQYWGNIKAYWVYLNTHWMLSYERIQELFDEVYGIKISQESLSNYSKVWFHSLEEFEKEVTKWLLHSELLHSDESGMRVWWKLHRAHVVASDRLTLYKIHEKRGWIAIDAHNILPQFTWKLVTDHYASYKKYNYSHFFCNAHHLRELSWVKEFEDKKWAEKLMNLLLRFKKIKETSIGNNIYFLEKEVVTKLSKEYLKILESWELEYQTPLKIAWKRGRVKKEKWYNLLLRLRKWIDWTLGFVHDFSVPFDNNLAERDLRMVKLKNKVSWCFRSSKWAKYFARTRSYISTLRKQNMKTFHWILSIFKWEIILPRM